MQSGRRESGPGKGAVGKLGALYLNRVGILGIDLPLLNNQEGVTQIKHVDSANAPEVTALQLRNLPTNHRLQLFALSCLVRCAPPGDFHKHRYTSALNPSLVVKRSQECSRAQVPFYTWSKCQSTCPGIVDYSRLAQRTLDH